MPRYLPRSVFLERERKRLEEVAQERGFDSAAQLFHQLYEVEGIPIEVIAREVLLTPLWTLRKRFDELGIKMRGRGGRNNVKIEVTQALVDEASRDGLRAVADRLGIDPFPLRLRLNRWMDEHKEENK